jgi:hypothetical protein
MERAFGSTANVATLSLILTVPLAAAEERIVEGRFVKVEPFAQQTVKADAYWSAAAKTPRTD